MKIVDIKTLVIKLDWLQLMYVKLITDEGITGIGETYYGRAGIHAMEGGDIAALKHFLIDENPYDVARLFQKMRGRYGAGQFPFWASIHAISGVEMALWDIIGKSLNVPIYQLLGGKFRKEILVYCDFGGGKSLEEYLEKIRLARKSGWTFIKFDVPLHNVENAFSGEVKKSEVHQIVNIVGSICENVGNHIKVAFDCHGYFNISSIKEVLRSIEKYEIAWLEDPIQPENPEALLKVTRMSKVPIAFGEGLSTAYAFRRYLELGAVDVIHPDILHNGGLLETKRIADMADIYYIPTAFHNVTSPVATIAAAHLAAAIPNFIALEHHWPYISWWDNLVKGIEKPLIDNGFIKVPDAPGIGVELNEKEVVKHVVVGDEDFFD